MTDSAKLRLDLPLVLPGIDGARDRCVARLIEWLRGRPGIAEAHIAGPDGPAPELCIHCDPATLSLGRVRELAHAAGAELSAAFGHLLITTAAAMQPRAATAVLFHDGSTLIVAANALRLLTYRAPARAAPTVRETTRAEVPR